MATTSQIQTFESTYAPYAAKAGGALNVSPSVILSQWAFESGYGTSTQAQSGNLAGIYSGTTPRTYASPDAFVSDYVSVIQKNDPAAVGTGSDSNAFVAGLKSGGYFTADQTAYAAGVAGAGNTLASADPTTYATLAQGGAPYTPTVVDPNTGFAYTPQTGNQPVTPTNLTGASQAAGGTCSGIGGVFTWTCWQGVMADVAIVVVGVGIIFFAVGSGVFGKSSTIQLVK